MTRVITFMRARVAQHPHVTALLLFSVVLGSVYSSVLVGDRSLLTNGSYHAGAFFIGDPAAGGPISLPLERLASLSWMHLKLPIVDPYQGYGIPLLADQGVPVYLPQLVVHLLFPNNPSIWNIINLLLIAFGSYLLAVSLGQRFLAAMAVGSAAALLGVAPPNLNMAMLNPFALLALVLLAIRYTVDPASEHRLVACLGVVTSVALLCMSGFQEVLPLFAVVVLVYGAAMVVHFGTFRLRPRLISSAVLAGVVGAIVGCVGLFPLLSVVRSQSTVNTPGAFAAHVPPYWLSTLTVPSLTERAMVGQPQDLGQTVWTLGSPLLVLVVVLSLALVLRREGRHLGWYVWPSVVLVVYGILGYADVFHVLKIFDLPLFTSILTIRFLQFAWWIPWCLLLGTVVSHARMVRRLDAIVSLLVAAVFDLYFVVRFRDALIAQHLARYLDHTMRATVLAALVTCAFIGAVLASRWIGSQGAAAAMAAVVLGSSLYYLPTNFFPASGATAASSLRTPGVGAAQGDHLAYLQLAQQPTTYYSVQVWGPIIPRPYQQVMDKLFSSNQTNGIGPLFGGAPTMGLVTSDTRFVEVLRSLGTDTIVSATALPSSILGPLPPCTSPSYGSPNEELCFLGRSSYVGGPPQSPSFAYEILDASPLVDPIGRVIAVSSTQTGLDDVLNRISPASTALPTSAYVTSNDPHLRAAQGVVGLSRTATTQSVSLALSSHSGGLAVLRETYEAGMHATVDGHSVRALPVDGGLWTAVEIGPGRSDVVLDYVSTQDILEFAIAGIGTLILMLAWLGVALVSLQSRRRRAVRGRHVRNSKSGAWQRLSRERLSAGG